MKGIWESPAAAAEAADRNRRQFRRSARRTRSGAVETTPVLFKSLPTMPVNGGGEKGTGVSRSCASVPSGVGVGFRTVFDSYWPAESVEEAIRRGDAFTAKFRVNAHNTAEAYCTIEGVPTDILINGNVAQNRAIEGDVVVILLEPVAAWTKLKGTHAASNHVAGDSGIPAEVREVVGDKSRGKQQANGHHENHHCNNGLPPPSIFGQYHENGDQDGTTSPDLVNGLAISQNSFTQHCAIPENSSALDRICAVISSYPSKRPTGKVLSIIKRSPRRDRVIGFLAVEQWFTEGEVHGKQINRHFPKMNNISSTLYGKEYIQLVPTDAKFPVMVVIVNSLPNNVRERLNNGDVTVGNELVAARIDEWSEDNIYPLAQVIDILGRGGEIEPQIAAIMFENAISAAIFSPESLDSLPDIPWEIPTKEFEVRKDLRDICTFTIDPSSAIDLDDALSLEIISNEVFRVGVHIADVSYFVCPESPLDTEAQIRSTSVYILQHRVPMLPKILSEELGSLKPGVDRLAVSVILDISASGDIINRWVGRTIIRSCCKLSYDHVQDIIDGKLGSDDFADPRSSGPQLHGPFKWKDIVTSLTILHKISKTLKEIRFKDGALWIENAKLVFLFDEYGTPYDGFLNGRTESCFVVEEYMLLANKSVAEIISRVFPDCALLRRHPEPNLRKLKEFEAFCSRHGFELDTSSSGTFNLSFSKIREKLKNDPVLLEILVSYASKPLQAATYFCTGDLRGMEDDWAHYGLSVPMYTHFTSPLRRYPDIVVHRTLSAALHAEAIYLKQRCIMFEEKRGAASGVETAGRCFTGLHFDKGAAESEQGREALSTAALMYKVPGSEVLGDVAAYCNERRLAARQAEESGVRLYLWAILKKKMFIISEARVVGLGPRFMSVYINKLGIERRIHFTEVEGLVVEWLEATCTAVLDLRGNKSLGRRCPSKFRPIEDAALVVNPSEQTEPEVPDTGDRTTNTLGLETLLIAENCQASPAFFPLVLKQLSTIPVALHAIGGDDGPLDVGVRLYMCSYFQEN